MTDALDKYNRTAYPSYLSLNKKALARHDRDRFRASFVLNKKCPCGNVRRLGSDFCDTCNQAQP